MLYLNALLQAGVQFLLAGVAFIIGLLIVWIVVSIPVWIAAKVLTLGKAKFTRAMLVTAIGPIIVAIVYLISRFLLSVAIGNLGAIGVLAFVLAFIAWIGVFKKGFDTGWLRAFAIAVLATVVFVALGFIITLVIRAFVPQAPPVTPIPLHTV